MVFLLVLCVAFIPVLLDGQDDGGMLGDFFLPEYALANDGAGGVNVEMDGDGNIILEGGDELQGTSRSSWNTLFGRYKNIITGFSGIATLTMLAAFIFLTHQAWCYFRQRQGKKRLLNRNTLYRTCYCWSWFRNYHHGFLLQCICRTIRKTTKRAIFALFIFGIYKI